MECRDNNNSMICPLPLLSHAIFLYVSHFSIEKHTINWLSIFYSMDVVMVIVMHGVLIMSEASITGCTCVFICFVC